MTMIADETQAYQALLEGHRADPDDEQLAEDLDKARRAMEIAWIEEIACTRNGPPASDSETR